MIIIVVVIPLLSSLLLQKLLKKATRRLHFMYLQPIFFSFVLIFDKWQDNIYVSFVRGIFVVVWVVLCLIDIYRIVSTRQAGDNSYGGSGPSSTLVIPPTLTEADKPSCCSSWGENTGLWLVRTGFSLVNTTGLVALTHISLSYT